MQYPQKETVLDDIRPLTIDLQDAFDESLAKADSVVKENYGNSRDGYLRSTLVRAGLRQTMRDQGYELKNIPNIGIDIVYDDRYGVKVVRSDHSGNVPAPATLARAAWCAAGQMRLSANGVDAETIWDVRRLGLSGCDIEGAVSSALAFQCDDLIHLLVDWEEIPGTGTVRMAVSMPVGAWSKSESPRVAWRCVLHRDASGFDSFVPTDDDLVVFIDDDEDDRGIGVAVG